MSIEHPNATAYRRTVDAFRAGDLAAIATLVDEDVVWHVPGSHPLVGDVCGRDDLLRWLAAVADVGFWLTEHDVFANDEHVCALSKMGARRAGAAPETKVVSIFHYHDGQQSERWFYPEDLAAWDRILDPSLD